MYFHLMDRIRSVLAKPWRGLYKSSSMFSYGSKTAWSAYEIQQQYYEAKELQKAEDVKNGKPTEEESDAMPMNLNALYGPNPTVERKKKVQEITKKLTRNM